MNARSPFQLNEAAPPVRRRRMTQRAARNLIVALVVTLALFGVVLTGSLLTDDDEAARSDTGSAVADSPGKPLAIDTLRTWLANDPQPLPGGTLVSWDGVEVTTPSVPPQEASATGSVSTEVHAFTVIDEGHGLYAATVTVEVHEQLGSRAVGTPSLERLAPSVVSGEGWGTGEDWPGYQSATPTDEVTDAVQAWAEAYTAGDPKRLRVAVGDADLEHAYMPLTTAAGVTSKITAAAVLTPQSPDDQPDSSILLVRVELRLAYPGQSTGTGAAKTVPVTYDLLVHGADAAAPRVVAWGPVGSGPQLTAYGNAITGRALTSGATSTVAPAATPAPTEG